MCLFKLIKEKRLKKFQESERRHLEFCLGRLNLTVNDLISMDGSEFDSFLSDLKEKVNAAPPEPARVYGPMPGYSLPNIFAWTEIVDSLENRRREAYRLNPDKTCEKCEKTGLVLIRFRSNPDSWAALCGREGYMVICPDCLTKISFEAFFLN